MSSYVPPCPFCGERYEDFRTGLTFADVKAMYWVEDPDSAKWKYKRRYTVLGKWRQIKLSLWDRHLEGCEKENAKIDQKSVDRPERAVNISIMDGAIDAP